VSAPIIRPVDPALAALINITTIEERLFPALTMAANDAATKLAQGRTLTMFQQHTYLLRTGLVYEPSPHPTSPLPMLLAVFGLETPFFQTNIVGGDVPSRRFTGSFPMAYGVQAGDHIDRYVYAPNREDGEAWARWGKSYNIPCKKHAMCPHAASQHYSPLCNLCTNGFPGCTACITDQKWFQFREAPVPDFVAQGKVARVYHGVKQAWGWTGNTAFTVGERKVTWRAIGGAVAAAAVAVAVGVVATRSAPEAATTPGAVVEAGPNRASKRRGHKHGKGGGNLMQAYGQMWLVKKIGDEWVAINHRGDVRKWGDETIDRIRAKGRDFGSVEEYLESAEEADDVEVNWQSTEEWAAERQAIIDDIEREWDKKTGGRGESVVTLPSTSLLVAKLCNMQDLPPPRKESKSAVAGPTVEAHTSSPTLPVDVFTKVCMIYTNDSDKGKWSFRGLGSYVSNKGKVWFITCQHVVDNTWMVVTPTNGVNTRWGPFRVSDERTIIFEKDVLAFISPKKILASSFNIGPCTLMSNVATMSVKSLGAGRYGFDSISTGQITRSVVSTSIHFDSSRSSSIDMNVVAHNCSTKSGCSGGPLVLMDGGKPKVAAIHVAGDEGLSINYAVPVKAEWWDMGSSPVVPAPPVSSPVGESAAIVIKPGLLISRHTRRCAWTVRSHLMRNRPITVCVILVLWLGRSKNEPQHLPWL